MYAGTSVRDAPPHFLLSWQKKTRRARCKRKPLCAKPAPLAPQLVEKVFSTSCLRFQNFQKVLKSIHLNGAGHPSWVPRAHPSFPFSYISGFIDSLRRRLRLICLKRGVPTRNIGQLMQSPALGAVLVLAISISLAAGLRRKLTHSDACPLLTKTAALGFRGGPYFAETCRRAARDELLSCVGLQDCFDFLLPSAAAPYDLPGSAK